MVRPDDASNDPLTSPGHASPLVDPESWPRLLEEVGVDSLLVVIEREMGARLREQMAAEDLWMLTLQHAWRDRARCKWSGVPAFRAWLLAIARNRIKDEIARLDAAKRLDGRATKFSALPADADGSISSLLPAITATPGRLAYYKERARIMAESLAALPADVEPIVRGYLFEQEPMEALAERMGIPLSTARSRFRRGSERYARKLRHLLGISGLESPPS